MSFFERPPVTLYLVRHGQSAANVDKNVYRTTADHAIDLTDLGLQQGREAGQFLQGELTRANKKTIILRSPYARARQTEAVVAEALGDRAVERVELVEMAEQQLGLFDGVPDAERAAHFPDEYQRFMLQHEFSGAFWARPPQGESPYDVYKRANTVTGFVKFASRRMDIDAFVLVGHANWMQCFAMAWCNQPFEWYKTSPLLKNAEILKIEGQTLTGVVFGPAQSTAEAPHAPVQQ